MTSRFLVKSEGLKRPPRAWRAYFNTACESLISAAAIVFDGSRAGELGQIEGGRLQAPIVGIADFGHDIAGALRQTFRIDPGRLAAALLIEARECLPVLAFDAGLRAFGRLLADENRQGIRLGDDGLREYPARRRTPEPGRSPGPRGPMVAQQGHSSSRRERGPGRQTSKSYVISAHRPLYPAVKTLATTGHARSASEPSKVILRTMFNV